MKSIGFSRIGSNPAAVVLCLCVYRAHVLFLAAQRYSDLTMHIYFGTQCKHQYATVLQL